jgi:class 3 adenylate cyclase
MESVAEAGEILVSDATAALIDHRLLAERKGPGTLVRDRALPDVESSFPPRAPASDDALAVALPVALREHLTDGGGDSEHRNATIAFIHFDGTDELIAREGPAAVERALDELVRHVQEAAAAHEVTFLSTDIDKDGGKIILTGGVPRTFGDDEGRVLRAVREIQDRARTLPVRIGVNRGPVFSGEVGPPFRRTYTIMGDAVNLAARLMAAAKPGQILSVSPVLALSRSAFETTALEPIRVKGKEKPVEPYALGAIRGTQQTRESAMLPLVGRDEELAAMMAALESTAEGWGRVVDLSGETGIGKTRLLAELRAAAIGVPSTVIVCEQYEQTTPFYAARALLQIALRISDPFGISPEDLTELVRGVAPDVVKWLPLIGDALGVPVPETDATAALERPFRRLRTTMALAELLEAAWADKQILAFEDVHWIDDASGDLLNHLCVTARQRPWLVVLTRRADDGGFRAPDGAVRIELGPLAPEKAAELVDEATVDTPLPPHEAKALVARSGGNPLFLEELVRVGRGGGADSLPDTLEAVMAIQVDSLAPSDRRLLRYASVLGMVRTWTRNGWAR